MKNIEKELKKRETLLLKWKKQTETALINAPEGSLRLCKHGQTTQYYHRTAPHDVNGTYIPRREKYLAQALAQKDYNQKILVAIEKELKAIYKFFSSNPDMDIERIYYSLHPARQKLIAPIYEPDDVYIQKWQSVNYEGKGFKDDVPEFYTSTGIRVRSKSELIIADLLNKEKIPYRYEYPICLNGIGRIYPDFTTLNTEKRKEIIWEHFGMMDDPVYIEKAIQKIALYEQNGFFPGDNLILTYETRKNPINQKLVLLLINKYLK